MHLRFGTSEKRRAPPVHFYIQALVEMQKEVIHSRDFNLLPADESVIRRSFYWIERYLLNATDAVVLESALPNDKHFALAGTTWSFSRQMLV